MRPMIRLAVLTVSLMTLAACASDQPPPRARGGGGDSGPRGVPNLFISPAGKPYRAERGQPYPVTQWFAAADTDHDGRLTQAEFRADAALFFQELDANHDGVIDGFELQYYERTIVPEINPQIEGLRFGEGLDLALGHNSAQGANIGRSPSRGSREQAGDQRPEGAGVFGLLNEPEPVAATDVKFDSHITLDEFLAAADRRFAALDKKNLGYLLLDSLPKTPAQLAIARIAAHHGPTEPTKLQPYRPGGVP